MTCSSGSGSSWWASGSRGSETGAGQGSGDTERPLRIVGVVADVRLDTLLGDPELVVYLPLAQHYSAPGNSVLVSVEGDPGEGVVRVEQALRAANPMIAIVNVLPYRDVVGGYLYERRMNAELFTLVALLRSALSCGGIFAIMSLVVGLRRRGLGIRVALGASRIEIVREVTHCVLLATAIGLGTGLVGAALAARMASGLLYSVAPSDPVAFVVGAGILLIAALLAAHVPTRRALRLDPMQSLRAD